MSNAPRAEDPVTAAASPCPIERELSLAAIRMEAGALAALLDELRPPLLLASTRRPGVSVQVLLAHLVRSVDRIASYLRAPVPPSVDVDWIDYWRTQAEREPDSATKPASTLNDQPVRDLWKRTWQTAVEDASHEADDRRVHTPYGDLRLDHYLTTRVLDVTLIGLDLRQALDLEEVATPFAVQISAAVLDGLHGGPRPEDLGDDLSFVLAATGRRAHADPSLPVLG